MEKNSDKSSGFLAKVRKQFGLKHILGLIIGCVGGYIYYRTVGCSTGACPITSNPFLTTLWGGLMGYLLADILPFKKKAQEPEKPEIG